MEDWRVLLDGALETAAMSGFLDLAKRLPDKPPVSLSSLLISTMSVNDLAAAAKVCSADPQAWLRTQQEQLKHDRLEAVLAALTPHLEPEDLSDAPVRACHRCLENRTDQLDYQGALALGLPVGSGEIESAHHSIVQQRLKRPSALCTLDNAEHMLALRLNRANGLREQDWENCASVLKAA